VMANEQTIKREWWVVDAADKPIGRVAAKVAALLRGEHKASYTPHVDTGDHVIVINAARTRLSGNSKRDERLYRHSGYPGGLKYTTRGREHDARPDRLMERAIRGMLPHNRLGRRMFLKLRVYAGPEHDQQAQSPKPREIEI